MSREPSITPRWLTLEGAAKYTGLSSRTIQTYIKANAIISANVVLPGNTRGRRLVDRISLDAFIQQFVKDYIDGKSDIAMNRQRNRQRKN